MALKPTIYKVKIELADSDRNCFETLALTIAQHPSETLERMAARLLAYCLNNIRGLTFTKGISTADEPDLWQHSDSGEIEHWIEMGQPEEPRLRRACGKAKRVSVYAFGKSTDVWWRKWEGELNQLDNLQVLRFDWQEIIALAQLFNRTIQLSVSIVGGTIYIDNGKQSCSVDLQSLKAVDD
jgi:uncharacterized protein YaeQ